jgi:hypothetical protein
MQLVTPLCAGIAGAENGTVDIFYRGSSLRAITYTSFEAAGAVTPTDALTLDAHGGRVVYVDAMVNCIVKDSSGTVVREFVAGVKDAAVECITKSFTGVDYATGASGASKPTNLQTILDAIYDSFGALDAKVSYAGTTRTVKSVLQSVGGMYVNVKDPTYGAAGDGATDDAAAVQAALTAASSLIAGTTLGATVFFPPGIYSLKSGLTVPYGVSLLGCGTRSSVLEMDTTTATTLTYSDGATPGTGVYPQTIYGMTIAPGVDCTGHAIDITVPTKLGIYDSSIGGPHSKEIVIACDTTTAAGGTLVLHNSFVQDGSSTTGCVVTSYVPLYANSCRFTTSATTKAGGIVVATRGCDISHSWFNNSAASSGTFEDISCDGSVSPNSISGCNFPNSAGATVTAIVAAGTGNVSEWGNSFGSSVTAYEFTAAATSSVTRQGFGLGTREHREEQIASNAIAVTPKADQYGVTVIHRTNATGQSISPAAPPGPGLRWTCIICNDSTTTPMTVDTDSFVGTMNTWESIDTITAQSAAIVDFVSADVNGHLVWVSTLQVALTLPFPMTPSAP